MATPQRHATRGFALTVHPDQARGDGHYAVALHETNGHPEARRQVARLPAHRLELASDALADALRTSKHPRTALKPTRRTPLALTEDAGVRLALAVNVVQGLSKPRRATRLLHALARLSDEECFYWYAHTLGTADPSVSRRRLKALRIFLAEE